MRGEQSRRLWVGRVCGQNAKTIGFAGLEFSDLS